MLKLEVVKTILEKNIQQIVCIEEVPKNAITINVTMKG